MQPKNDKEKELETIEVFYESIVYPQTEHNQELKAKRMHEAEQVRQQKEEMRKKMQQDDQAKHLQQLEEQKQLDIVMKQKQEEERRKKEEMEQRSKLVYTHMLIIYNEIGRSFRTNAK